MRQIVAYETGAELDTERESVVYENATSKVFWSAMLPICWVLAPLLGLMAQMQANSGRSLEDRMLQSTLFMALFLAGFGLMAVRVVVGQAIEEHHKAQAVVVTVLSIVSSAALITYGVFTLA